MAPTAVIPATSKMIPPTTISVGSAPSKTSTPWLPRALTPVATKVINAAPVNWAKNGGSRRLVAHTTNRSTAKPARKVIIRICHDTVNNSVTAGAMAALPTDATQPE